MRATAPPPAVHSGQTIAHRPIGQLLLPLDAAGLASGAEVLAVPLARAPSAETVLV
jgi:hypothetical protein